MIAPVHDDIVTGACLTLAAAKDLRTAAKRLQRVATRIERAQTDAAAIGLDTNAGASG